jgi:hypothetical protein
MLDYDRPTTIVSRTARGSGLSLAAGVVVVAVLVGAYVLMGAPGLHTQVAKAPASQGIDVTVEQPATPAPATPDSAGPAPGR